MESRGDRGKFLLTTISPVKDLASGRAFREREKPLSEGTRGTRELGGLSDQSERSRNAPRSGAPVVFKLGSVHILIFRQYVLIQRHNEIAMR